MTRDYKLNGDTQRISGDIEARTGSHVIHACRLVYSESRRRDLHLEHHDGLAHCSRNRKCKMQLSLEPP